MPTSIQFDLRCAACGQARTRAWSAPRQPTATFCLCGRPMSVLAVQVERANPELAPNPGGLGRRAAGRLR